MKPNHANESASVIGVPLYLGIVSFYWLDELLAALIVLTLVFVTAGVAILSVFLLEHAALKGITHFAGGMARARARRNAVSVHPRIDRELKSLPWK
jgi:hypothetical protein